MKINLSMDFIRPVAVAVKKYTSLLPSVVVTLVALLMFIPLLWLGGKVKAEMQISSQNAGTVQSLISQAPTEAKVQQVRIYMDKLKKDAEELEQKSIQSSQRDLMTYDYVIFPAPSDASSQIYDVFGRKYRAAIEALLTEKMNAKDAPSEAEIRAKTGARPAGAGRLEGSLRIETQNPMVDALCLTRADEISVYANPDVFAWYSFWQAYEFKGKDQALQDCWDSQVAYWVYEDIVDTIIKMNGTSGKVKSAPVKRLLGVSFTGPVVNQNDRNVGGMGNLNTATASRDIPVYITPTSPGPFVSGSPTYRTGNDDVDVIHFAVSVVLDNRSVLAFMKELCTEKAHTYYPDFDASTGDPIESRHNQISILESNITVVDKADPAHELYRYGKSAAMRLDLVCEYLFVRKGYDMIKPDPIRKRLGQEITGEENPESGV